MSAGQMTAFSALVSVCSGLGSIVTLLVLLAKPVRERLFGMSAIREGQKCMLRADMLATYYTVGGAIIVVFITLKHKFIATTDVEPLEVNIKTIGHHMLSGDKYGYLLPFEAVSILLLACIVGGLLIARKR